MKIKNYMFLLSLLFIFTACVKNNSTSQTPDVSETSPIPQSELPNAQKNTTHLGEANTGCIDDTDFSDIEYEVMDFILENYPVIFFDAPMLFTKYYAYQYGLTQDIPKGMGDLVPYDFDLYDWDNDHNFEMVVYSKRLETEGHCYIFYRFTDGAFQKIGESGYYCSLLKDSNGKVIIAEQDNWNDVCENNMKFSYLEIKNSVIERTPFINIVRQKDEISGTKYPSWEDIEKLMNSFEFIEKIPTENIKNSIKAKAQIQNEKHISWKDLYADFVSLNAKINSKFALLDYDDDGIPEIILDNNVYTLKDGKVVFIKNNCHQDVLQAYPTNDQRIYYKVIYEYVN